MTSEHEVIDVSDGTDAPGGACPECGQLDVSYQNRDDDRVQCDACVWTGWSDELVAAPTPATLDRFRPDRIRYRMALAGCTGEDAESCINADPPCAPDECAGALARSLPDDALRDAAARVLARAAVRPRHLDDHHYYTELAWSITTTARDAATREAAELASS